MVYLSHFYAGHLHGVIHDQVHMVKDGADYGGVILKYGEPPDCSGIQGTRRDHDVVLLRDLFVNFNRPGVISAHSFRYPRGQGFFGAHIEICG